MRRIVVASLIAVLWTAGQAYAGPPAPLSTPELQKVIGSGKKNTVVFFLNPEGGPCRVQNEILQQLYKDRGAKFNIAYVSATQPGNEKAFYDYGVRGLPSLVVVDKEGKVARVFPPGIQSYQVLAATLDGMK